MSDIKDPFVMAAKLLNPYLVTSVLAQSTSAPSNDFADYQRVIRPDGALTLQPEAGDEFSMMYTNRLPRAKYQQIIYLFPNSTEHTLQRACSIDNTFYRHIL